MRVEARSRRWQRLLWVDLGWLTVPTLLLVEPTALLNFCRAFRGRNATQRLLLRNRILGCNLFIDLLPSFGRPQLVEPVLELLHELRYWNVAQISRRPKIQQQLDNLTICVLLALNILLLFASISLLVQLERRLIALHELLFQNLILVL